MGDHNSMSDNDADSGIDYKESFASSALFKSLFEEGMDLVKEAAAYLDGPGRTEAQNLIRDDNLLYTTQSMVLTTRLMQMASWLLVHRAVGEGEISSEDSQSKQNRVVIEAPEDELPDISEKLPEGFRDLIRRSHAMQDRIARMDRAITDNKEPQACGPNALSTQLDQLTAAFGAPQAGDETNNS